MGILKCACKAEAEGKTFEEADEKIDHGIALSSAGPGCSGYPTRMTWDEKGGYDKKTDKLIVKNPKPVASSGIVMLVGKDAKDPSKDGDSKQIDSLNKTITSLKEKLSQVGGELKTTKAALKEAEDELKEPVKPSGDENPKNPKN